MRPSGPIAALRGGIAAPINALADEGAALDEEPNRYEIEDEAPFDLEAERARWQADTAGRNFEADAKAGLVALVATARVLSAEGPLPVGRAAVSPETPCCDLEPARLCFYTGPSDLRLDPVWYALDFVPPTTTGRAQFAYQSDGTTFTGTAWVDAACEGLVTKISVTGTATPQGMLVEWEN